MALGGAMSGRGGVGVYKISEGYKVWEYLDAGIL